MVVDNDTSQPSIRLNQYFTLVVNKIQCLREMEDHKVDCNVELCLNVCFVF